MGRAFIEVNSPRTPANGTTFPFLYGGTFIEVTTLQAPPPRPPSFPYPSVGTFIKALRSRRIMKDSQLSDFPTAFVGTFPNLFLLRSWIYHSPGTELFLFRRAGSNQTKTPPASCYPPPPPIQAENSTRRNSVINSLISQNTPPQC